jgi:Holliday junction resolvasome RuvABC endonuclease subunit
MRSQTKWDIDRLRITGLDLSLSSPGIAHISPYGEIPIATRSIKTESSESWHTRIHRVATGIRDEVIKFDPDFIFIENYSFNSKFGREIAGEVHGVVLYLLHQCGYDNTFRVIAPTSLKQFAANNTKAKKKEIIDAIKEYYGITFKQSQNDQADAFVLAKIGEILVWREHSDRNPVLGHTIPKHKEVVVQKALENLRSDSTWLNMFNQRK